MNINSGLHVFGHKGSIEKKRRECFPHKTIEHLLKIKNFSLKRNCKSIIICDLFLKLGKSWIILTKFCFNVLWEGKKFVLRNSALLPLCVWREVKLLKVRSFSRRFLWPSSLFPQTLCLTMLCRITLGMNTLLFPVVHPVIQVSSKEHDPIFGII